MGTITRTFANNITTSGVFKPTAFNDASFDNVTAVPGGAVEGGNMVLLSTQTASGDASISFTSGIDSTYKEYMFVFNNIHPATDNAHFQFNFSTDAGSTYDVIKTSTIFRSLNFEDDSLTSLDYRTAYHLAQSTDYAYLGSQQGNGADESCSGTMHLFNPSDTTFVKHFTTNCNFYNYNSASEQLCGAGYGNTTSAIDAVIFRMSSGNIDDGTIQMFGIL
jgi:hypothetical protein